MNDILLSSIINLFALFSADNSLDKEKSLELIRGYLTDVFAIRDYQTYLDLYSDLLDFYQMDPDLNKEDVVNSICGKLREKFTREDIGATTLRLMEFCSFSEKGFSPDSFVFRSLASNFSISEKSMNKYLNFINGVEDDSVHLMPYAGGTLRVLFLRGHMTMLITYVGEGKVLMNGIPVKSGVFQTFHQSSVMSSRNCSNIYFSTLAASFVKDDNNKPVELCGRDVNFRFDQGGDNGMHNLSFTLRGGELVAVMGGSGVGKSTLLSLLNGNLKPQSGSITINGHDIAEPEAKSLIGFVPQDDLLIEELTVYENLWYTAKFCFEGMSEEELDERVMAMLRQLGLEQAKDLKVGSPLNKFISGGQRKRLNIALELIREPAILYLDEPTSGLSSADTEKVVTLLKDQTGRGKLIVANIHQPSSDVYKLFDRLWLLDKGGYPIYDGNPIEAISYFKSKANYADNESPSCPVCGTVNPELVLNIIEEKAIDTSGRISEQRKISPQQWHGMYLDKQKQRVSDVAESPIPKTDQKRPSKLKQMALFIRRNIRSKITNLQYVLVTLLEAPALAVICALLTHYSIAGSEYTLMDNKNLVSYYFMAIIVSIFLGMSGSAEEIIKDRALLKREKFLNLSYGSYIWSKIIYMAGICLIQTLLFIVVGNLIMGVSPSLFGIWWLILFISAFLSALIGLLLSQCMNSVVAIYITIPLLLIPQILLCGLVVKFEDLNPESTTGNVSIVGDCIPSRWAFEALAVSNFKDNPYEKMFFEADRLKYESLFFDEAIAYELRSKVETRRADSLAGKSENPHNLAYIRNELPALSSYCSMEEYNGDYSYSSLMEYLDNASVILNKMRNRYTLEVDRLKSDYIRENGMDSLKALKRDNYNLSLEDLLMNRDTEHPYVIVDDHLVPRCDYVFLLPRSRNGRAPFYSPVKRIGDMQISTLCFNMGVMLLMCLLFTVLLLTDVPGKFVRKERN